MNRLMKRVQVVLFLLVLALLLHQRLVQWLVMSKRITVEEKAAQEPSIIAHDVQQTIPAGALAETHAAEPPLAPINQSHEPESQSIPPALTEGHTIDANAGIASKNGEEKSIPSIQQPSIEKALNVSNPSDLSTATSNDVSHVTHKKKHCIVHDFSIFMNNSDPVEFECVRVKGGSPDLMVCLYPDQQDLIISKAIRLRGSFEPSLTKSIVQAMKRYPKSKFLDIGANIGMHTLSLAKLGYDVIAVEPKYSTLQRLHKGVNVNRLRNKITLLTIGLSNVRQNITLYSSTIHPGGSSVIKGDRSLSQTIQTVLMDDLLEVIDAGQELVVKMDIEAAECDALANATKFFGALNVHVIFMEWMGMQGILRNGHSHDRILMIKAMLVTLRKEGFEARGFYYKLFDLQKPKTLPPVLDYNDTLNWPENIVWVRPDAVPRRR